MAGKRQHYVPKLLQRGFLDSSPVDAERTWLHLHGRDARLVGIGDVGVKDWFYSKKSVDGNPTLDDIITDLERDLSASIHKMRASEPGTTFDPDVAAQTVVHLVIRTDHLRRAMTEGMNSITKEIESLFIDRERLGDMLGLSQTGPSALVSEAIQESTAKLAVAGIPKTFAERLMTFEIREFGDQLVEQVAAMLGPMFPEMFDDLGKKIRDAHNSILATTPDDNLRIETLSSFKWTVEAGEHLILPDAVALASRGNDDPLMPFLFSSAVDTGVVVLPISTDRLLVGRATSDVSVDLTRFNAQAAASCEVFFIGAKSFDDDNLSQLIGSATATEMEGTIKEAVREIEHRQINADKILSPVEPVEVSAQEFSYSLRLADFGDENLVKDIADVLNVVVKSLGRFLPLHELDGFTLADDYEKALKSLDRGDSDLPPVSSNAIGDCLGVAMPVTVVRDGKRKEHLVIAAGLALSWLSDDSELRKSGILHPHKNAR